MKLSKCSIFFITLFLVAILSNAQPILQRKISVQIHQKQLSTALKQIEAQGNFYFSYASNVVKADSVVTITARNKTVSEILGVLFGYRYSYTESNGHLIIHPNTSVSKQAWYVNGKVLDKTSNEPVAAATVYEPSQLVYAITDDYGNFKLQFKERPPSVTVIVSRINYLDTSISINEGQRNIQIALEPTIYDIDTVAITNVERNWLARQFISTKQVMNSMNLNHFFARQPLQFSLVPGLGSHGKMGAQVINKFSFNVVGGYTAGVNGFELGNIFNIVKQDVKYVQIGGLFNIVGGGVKGFQLGGLYNSVGDSICGVQIGGISNMVSENVSGIQIGGLFNIVKSVNGIQLAGITNIVRDRAKGIQLAGIGNYSKKKMNGIQLAGLYNITSEVRGVQIGFVNYADTSSGYSIGIINIIRKGYHKLSISSTENQIITLAYKSGSRKLYSILALGANINTSQKAYSLGYGLGSDLFLSKNKKWFFNPEAINQYFYAGSFTQSNLLARANVNIKYRFHKNIAIYAGPSLSVQYGYANTTAEGYKSDLASGFPTFDISKKVKGWIGWNVGFDLF